MMLRGPHRHPNVQKASPLEHRLKGRISKTLESILLDPTARRELREHLIRGRDGWVRVNGKTYRVQIDVTSKLKSPIGRRFAEAG
jgi:hypothetical protein